MGRYGIEAEFFGMDPEEAAEVLRVNGVDTYAEEYNHRTRTHWKIVEDGSVSGEGNELVSPILNTTMPTNTRQVKTALPALRKAGGTIDSSCGLHVHHDATRISTRGLAALVGAYGLYQNVINSILPPSRRSVAEYTAPITKADYLQSLDVIDTNEARWAGWSADNSATANQCYWGNRYSAINLSAIEAHGTVEFRQHSGTLNGTKAYWWVKLTNGFMSHIVLDTDWTERKLLEFDKDWRSAMDSLSLVDMCRFAGIPLAGVQFFENRQKELLNMHERGPDKPGVKDWEDSASEEYPFDHDRSVRQGRCESCGNHFDDCSCCGNCGYDAYADDHNCCSNCGSSDRDTCGCCGDCDRTEYSLRRYGHREWCSHADPATAPVEYIEAVPPQLTQSSPNAVPWSLSTETTTRPAGIVNSSEDPNRRTRSDGQDEYLCACGDWHIVGR